MLKEPDLMSSQPTRQLLLEKTWQYLRQRDFRQAIDQSNLMVRQYPQFAPGWHAASHVAQLIKKPQSALVAIDKAIELEPASTDWQLHKVSCLLLCSHNTDAKKLLMTLLSGSASFSLLQLSQLAFLCNRMELFDEAAEVYEKLTRLEPENGGHWYNLASIQRFMGKLDDAETNLERAIKLNPADYEAYELRSNLRGQTRVSNHIDELQSLLESGIPLPSGEVQICYALAKELEDTGDAKRSFKALSRGASVRRKHLDYDISSDIRTIDAIIDGFNTALLNNTKGGYASREPVFIIGLPRTGTTLVERVLGRHSEVFAAGELDNFAKQLIQQVRQDSGPQAQSREALVQQTTMLDFQALGRSYIESTRPKTGHTPHFVDKMPLNFLYAGLIHLALPDARIIHLQRHPMDTCYAIYKQLFKDGYPWSYDLDEIADYYLAYHRLMAHWRKVLPDSIYEISYEKLVTNFDSEARSLVEFCGLDWQPQCLDFDQSSQATTTASAAQVRQAVYTTSIRRWRQYADSLDPLLKKLINAGIPIDD